MKKTLSAGWRVKKLGDVAKVIPGFAFKSKDWCKEGIPVIKIKNIVGDLSVDTVEADCVPSDILTDKLRKFVLDDGDILVAMTGATAGKVGRLRCKRPHLLNQRVAKLAPFDVDPHFFWAVVSSDEYRDRFFKLADGAAQPNMSGGQIESVELLIPLSSTQRKIAGVLSAYDDLIENNSRRIAILEEMAQAIYREWFVHFRFPGHEQVKLINSPLGKIPEGWKVGVISDVVRLLSGFAFKSGTFVDGGEYRLVTIKNVHDGRFVEESNSLLDALPDKMPDHCHLSSGDILLSLTGNIGRTCIVYGSGFLLNQRVAKLSPVNAADKGYVYCLFRSPDTQVRLSNIANGVAQQNLSPVQTGHLPHALPPRALLDAFADTLTPMIGNIVQLYRKNSNLCKTRDLLLPKLMSGQLDVAELDIETGQPLLEATA